MAPTLVFALAPDGSMGDFVMGAGSPIGSTILQYVLRTLVGGLRTMGHTVRGSAQSSGISTIVNAQRNGAAMLEGAADPWREGIGLGDIFKP